MTSSRGIKKLMRDALEGFIAGRGDPTFEAHGLRARDVRAAEKELAAEAPDLFRYVKRTFYEDGKTWWANMDDAGWAVHRQARSAVIDAR